MFLQFCQNGKFDRIFHVLVLCTKGDSLICFSKKVEKNEMIQNEDIKICPGHYIRSQEVESVLKGENHFERWWKLPSGILDYSIENKKVQTKQNHNYFSFI